MAKIACVILAAGQSIRMKSNLSKVLHPLAGRPVISYPIAAALGTGAERLLVVCGPKHDDLKEYLKARKIELVIQKDPLGTADAVKSAGRALASFKGYVLILCGDVPLVRPEVLRKFVSDVEQRAAKMGVLTMAPDDPFSYGRIVRDSFGSVIKIAEEKDATDAEREIREVNSGIICADCEWLFSYLKKIGNKNAKREYYLTDLFGIAAVEGEFVVGFAGEPAGDFLGINTRIDLARVMGLMQRRINDEHMLKGVGILDPGNTSIDADVKIGEETAIMPYTFISGDTKIGKNCTIENGVVIRNAQIGDGVHIKSYSVIDDSAISAEAQVGPFARIRPGSKIGIRARVGNFVELKKCELGVGSKANHLTYLGDTVVGKSANIGCGTITCNYDGREKHKTIIGDEVFVGSDTQFVAPVKIGRGCTIGAGSTITKDVPADALALSRAEQVVVKNWAKKKRKV